MKRMPGLILGIVSASLLVFLLFKVFVPRHYQIPPINKRGTTQHMILSSGSQIAYTSLKGKGIKKPYPIIYLHGGPGGVISDQIIDVCANFTEDGYDVFLYDQIGSGASARLENIKEYTIERHISDLHDIIKTISPDGKAILIGHSWGSILAACFSGAYPTMVDKIIFCNPGPLLPCPGGLDTVKAPDSLHLKAPFFSNAQGNAKVKNIRTDAIKFAAIHFGIKLATDQEADQFSTYANFEINRSTVYDTGKIIKLTEYNPVPRSGYYAGVMTFESLLNSADRRPALRNLLVPVLVLKSQYDNQLWGWTNEYLQLFQHHQLVIIPNAGHDIIREKAELYVQKIRLFLSDANSLP